MRFSGGVTSFAQLLEDPALKGKVAIEDNPKYGIAMAALALGFEDPYDLTDADLAQVKQWYADRASQIKSFYSDESEFFDLFQSGDIVAGFGYKGYDVGLAKQGAIRRVRSRFGRCSHVDLRIFARSERREPGRSVFVARLVPDP